MTNGSTIYILALHKQLTNIDGISGIWFKLIGNKIKIISYYNILHPYHLLYNNIKKNLISLLYVLGHKGGLYELFLFSYFYTSNICQENNYKGIAEGAGALLPFLT